jgi:hypothetical protein
MATVWVAVSPAMPIHHLEAVSVGLMMMMMMMRQTSQQPVSSH